MKLFYIAVAKDGKRVKGFIDAADVSKAALYLRDHALLPVRIEQQSAKNTFSFLQFMNKVKNRDIIFFTRQLSSMLASGLTISQSLGLLINQTQKQSVATMIQGIIINVEEGKSLSDALSQYPSVFTPVYLSLVKAGESTGLLDKVMNRLAENLEKQDKLRAQIRSALLYPAIVVTLMVIVVIVMMVVVIPQLNTLYESLNVALPLPTEIVIRLSNFITNYILFIIIASGFGGYYGNKWRKTERGKIMLDKIILHVPIFNKLIKQSTIAEFSRTFAMLIGTGALIIDSLNKTADVLTNSVYRREVKRVAENVEKGVSIGDSMGTSEIFPPMLVEMVKVGEQTGKLDDSLTRVSEYFEREVEQTVKALTTAMEPIIMVVLALGVGFLIIAIITPIYKIISSF